MKRLLPVAAVCAGLAAFHAAAPALALSNRELFDILTTRSSAILAGDFESRALEGLVKAADPRGILTTPAAAAARTDGTTVERFDHWPDGIAYLKLGGLYDSGVQSLEETLRTLSTSEVSGVLLDLRGAGGSGLRAADTLLSAIIPAATPLYVVQDQTGSVVASHAAQASDVRLEMPIMVLADCDTREAPELFCAVVRGHPRILIVGNRTSGDLNLRGVLTMSETQALYVATHRVIPACSTNNAPARGMEPDITLTRSYAAIYAMPPTPHRSTERPLSTKALQDMELMLKVMSDPALARATDILLGLHALERSDHGLDDDRRPATPHNTPPPLEHLSTPEK